MSVVTNVIRITEHQDKLIFAFPPHRKAVLSAVKKIQGSRFRKDKKWEVPREAAEQLLDIREIREGNASLLQGIADEVRPILAQRSQLQKRIAQTGEAPAALLYQARYPRYVARSRKKKGHVVARYARDPKIDRIIQEKAGGLFNARTDSTTFLEADLALVAKDLKKEGFAFETGLLDAARETYQLLKAPHVFQPPVLSKKAWELRAAADAKVPFVGRNGFDPRPDQRAIVAYALHCLKEIGGTGLLLEMGVGKTLSDLIIHHFIKQHRPDIRHLIFAPLNPIVSWTDELFSWLGVQSFYADKKTGERGREALGWALDTRDPGQDVAVVLGGEDKVRKEVLAMDPPIVIVNYDLARTDVMAQDIADWVARGERALFTCDESQRFKTAESVTSQTILELVQMPQFQKESGGGRLLLTGTMIPQGPFEAWSQITFIDGGPKQSRLGPSPYHFRRRYFHIDFGTQKRKRVDPKGFRNAELRTEFIQLLEPGTIRKTSAEVQDLPDLTLDLLSLDLDDSFECKMYRYLARLKEGELEDGEEESTMNEDLIFLRMKQVLSHPANLLESLKAAQNNQAVIAELERRAVEDGEIIDEAEFKIKNQDLLGLSDEWIQRLERFVEQKKKPKKLAVLLDKARDIFDAKQKFIVGCDYTATEYALIEEFDTYGVAHFRAGMKPDEVKDLMDRFRNDPRCRVAIGKASVMARGLNLQAANHLFLYDPTCGGSTEAWDQFKKRHHRGGQTQPCWVHHMVFQDTAEVYQLAKVISRAQEASKIQQDTVNSLPPSVREFLNKGKFTARPRNKKEALSLLSALGGGR